MADFVEPFDRLRAGYGHPNLAASFTSYYLNCIGWTITIVPTILTGARSGKLLV
jgi:hypothetical protein